jgi:hypothetical protein
MVFCRTWYEISFSRYYYLKPNHVPLQFHDLISIQKTVGLFPFTQTQNNLEWKLFWRNRLPPSSVWFLKMQTVIHSETLLPRPHVILTYTTLFIHHRKTEAKNTVDGSCKKNWITSTTLCSEPTVHDVCCCTLHPFWVTVCTACQMKQQSKMI